MCVWGMERGGGAWGVNVEVMEEMETIKHISSIRVMETVELSADAFTQSDGMKVHTFDT